MFNKKQGFTLMEIMVVIVVIAVLASVAGPMIGSITDQGRASATKSKLSALKSALLAFQADVGRLPYIGKKVHDGEAYCQDKLLSFKSDSNVLTCGGEDLMKTTEGKPSVRKYKSKWKGPYMESEPDDFMVDSWGTKIRYVAAEGHQNIYLWSAGPDLAFYGDGDSGGAADDKGLNCVINGEPDETAYKEVPLDDIILSVAKLRKKLTGENGWKTVYGELESE